MTNGPFPLFPFTSEISCFPPIFSNLSSLSLSPISHHHTPQLLFRSPFLSPFHLVCSAQPHSRAQVSCLYYSAPNVWIVYVNYKSRPWSIFSFISTRSLIFHLQVPTSLFYFCFLWWCMLMWEGLLASKLPRRSANAQEQGREEKKKNPAGDYGWFLASCFFFVLPFPLIQPCPLFCPRHFQT